jgi:transcriptional regulator with GAF, ATPase, and Fis domain
VAAVERRLEASSLEAAAGVRSRSSADADGAIGGKASLALAKRAFERWLVRSRLEEFRGNIAAAARSLNMDRGQLSRLVKRYEIDRKAIRRRRND